MSTILIAHQSFQIGAIEKDAFDAIGAELIQTEDLDSKLARQILPKADAVMVTIQTVSSRHIADMNVCKILARVGVGLDAIDIPAATERGIWVTNVGDYAIDEVSTHAIALLLNHARRLPRMFASARAGNWYDAAVIEPIPRLKGQVLGLIGYGRIGRAVAEKAKALGLEVIVYDPFIEAEDGLHLVDFDALLAGADYISLHAPLSDSSRRIINAQALAKMKTRAYLINTARGELIDEAALLAAVENGVIAGAALDVLSVEPPPSDYPLLHDERIAITPHAGWYSEAAKLDVRVKANADVARVLNGGRPLSPVNQPRGIH